MGFRRMTPEAREAWDKRIATLEARIVLLAVQMVEVPELEVGIVRGAMDLFSSRFRPQTRARILSEDGSEFCSRAVNSTGKRGIFRALVSLRQALHYRQRERR